MEPGWNEDPLPYLESVGDQVLPQTDPVAGDLQSARRVWILSESERADEAFESLPYAPSRPDKKRFGDVTVFETRVPSSIQASYELLDHLEEAVVERVDGESVETCDNWSQRDRRWDCGGRDRWLFVGEKFASLADDPHECIWAHPVGEGRTLRITFPDVPLERFLRIRAGLTDLGSVIEDAVPVHLTVSIGDDTRVKHTYGARETNWFPHDIPTPELQGETRDVVLEVRASDTKNRWFCLNGWVR